MKDQDLKAHMQGFCLKCPHRPTCTSPCPPVYKYADRGRRTFEREGDKIIIIYPPSSEVHFSDMTKTALEKDQEYEGSVDEHADFWGACSVRSKQLGIFADRFFNTWSFEDLAVKYDCTPQQANAIYQKGKARILKVLEAMNAMSCDRREQMERTTGRFTKKVRAFLLAKCFNLTVSEISEVLGSHSSSVSKWIKEGAEKVRAGQLVLAFEGEDLEARAVNAVCLAPQVDPEMAGQAS